MYTHQMKIKLKKGNNGNTRKITVTNKALNLQRQPQDYILSLKIK